MRYNISKFHELTKLYKATEGHRVPYHLYNKDIIKNIEEFNNYLITTKDATLDLHIKNLTDDSINKDKIITLPLKTRWKTPYVNGILTRFNNLDYYFNETTNADVQLLKYGKKIKSIDKKIEDKKLLIKNPEPKTNIPLQKQNLKKLQSERNRNKELINKLIKVCGRTSEVKDKIIENSKILFNIDQIKSDILNLKDSTSKGYARFLKLCEFNKEDCKFTKQLDERIGQLKDDLTVLQKRYDSNEQLINETSVDPRKIDSIASDYIKERVIIEQKYNNNLKRIIRYKNKLKYLKTSLNVVNYSVNSEVHKYINLIEKLNSKNLIITHELNVIDKIIEDTTHLNEQLSRTLVTLTLDQSDETTSDLKKPIPEAFELLKNSFEKLLKSVKKMREGVDYVWVMEPQKNGYPHIHILFLTEFSNDEQERLRRLWSTKYHAGSYEYGIDFSIRKPKTYDKNKPDAIISARMYFIKNFEDLTKNKKWSLPEWAYYSTIYKHGYRIYGESFNLSKVMKPIDIKKIKEEDAEEGTPASSLSVVKVVLNYRNWKTKKIESFIVWDKSFVYDDEDEESNKCGEEYGNNLALALIKKSSYLIYGDMPNNTEYLITQSILREDRLNKNAPPKSKFCIGMEG